MHRGRRCTRASGLVVPYNWWNSCSTTAPTQTHPAPTVDPHTSWRYGRAGPAAERQLDRGRVRLDQLTDDDRATLYRAAQTGNTAVIQLMLDLGFPINARGGDDGGTPLHAAAYAGSAETLRLLLDTGADLEALDTTWNDTPIGWAIVGSGERPTHNPNPDWVATVRTLIDAGASTHGITLSPDDGKPPSPEVAELLRAHGVPDEER
jgi:hypothetical protein